MKGWKLDGKYTVRVMRQRVEELESQGCETHVDRFTGVLYFRKKKKSRVQKAQRKPVRDYANQSFLEQKRREKLQDRIWKLFGLWILIVVATITVGAEHPDRVMAKDFEVNLAPVRFTEQELQALKDRSQQIAEEKKLSAYTDVEKKIYEYFGKDTDWAIRCFKSESGLRPNAINDKNRNKTIDVGLAQINTPTHCSKLGESNWNRCIESLQDVDTNLKVAKMIYDRQGSKPWYGRHCN